jgi:tRNA pseudouridine38-40 synthase
MPRYFLEVSYKGTNYSGFQAQKNAPHTIQAEIEKVFNILHKQAQNEGGKLLRLTGSSRTDTGVHALQNFFHFDLEENIHPQFAYKMNAILPPDIVVRKLYPVVPDAHCRFDALSRAYKYFIYRHKDAFLVDRAFYFPYKLDMKALQEAADLIMNYDDFTSFSKRNTQVKTFNCRIMESKWVWENDCLVYHVKANRFLRGMVRALTATMLKVGRGKMSIEELNDVIKARDCKLASFAVPAQGLFLVSVEYPADRFIP